MVSILIPVLLCFFLGPGAGQLYNRDYKKGVFMMVASLVVLIVAGVWYYKALQPFIPSDLTNVDPAALQQILQNATAQINAGQSRLLMAFEAALTALWIYACFDAYLVAQKKQKE